MGISKFLPENYVLDHAQIKAVEQLNIIANNLQKNSIFKFFKKPFIYSGIYLYGGVGRGKTMLMRSFYQAMVQAAQFVHYQDFMQEVHLNMHKLQNISKDKIINDIASKYARNTQIICLDEFEIKDIADAMIVGKLLQTLVKLKVFIFITSNAAPINLYKDGVQRESFLPFIDFINKKFAVIYLAAERDYRDDKIINPNNNRIIYPLNNETKKNIEHIIIQTTKNDLQPFYLELFGRKISFIKTFQQILVTDFAELFMQDLGYIDYVNICRYFKTIILTDVPIIAEDNSDLATRFINFVDNAYFNKILLYASLAATPAQLYKKGKLAAEFKRTSSRLHEMNSNNYLETIYEKF